MIDMSVDSDLRLISLLMVVVYFIFTWWDEKQIKDEREDLIRLKTHEFVHRLTLTLLSGLAIFVLFFPGLLAMLPIMVLILGAMYGEIVGKIYYRNKL